MVAGEGFEPSKAEPGISFPTYISDLLEVNLVLDRRRCLSTFFCIPYVRVVQISWISGRRNIGARYSTRPGSQERCFPNN